MRLSRTGVVTVPLDLARQASFLPQLVTDLKPVSVEYCLLVVGDLSLPECELLPLN